MISEKLMLVHDLILKGGDAVKIQHAIQNKFPDDDAAKLISDAVEIIIESTNQPREALIGWAIESTKNVYRQCIQIGDVGGALRAAKQLSEMAMFLSPKNTTKK